MMIDISKTNNYHKCEPISIELAEFLKIISEQNRLRIICFLANGEKCVCKIQNFLDISQNLTSHHLSVLRKNEIIYSKKVGQNVYYRLNDEKISFFKNAINNILNIGKDKNND